jgi:hypothetical protein
MLVAIGSHFFFGDNTSSCGPMTMIQNIGLAGFTVCRKTPASYQGIGLALPQVLQIQMPL